MASFFTGSAHCTIHGAVLRFLPHIDLIPDLLKKSILDTEVPLCQRRLLLSSTMYYLVDKLSRGYSLCDEVYTAITCIIR